MTALGARCGVPALTAPLAAGAFSGLSAMGPLWWHHPRLVQDGAGWSTASRWYRDIGSGEEIIESLHND